MCIDSDETVRYNLLLEENQKEEETIEENLQIEFSQELPEEETAVDEVIMEEIAYLDENESENAVISEDAVEYEVYSLDSIDLINEEGPKEISEKSIEEKNQDYVVREFEFDSLTEKMRAAHFAKEQLKKHKCPYCEKSFLYPSKGKIRFFVQDHLHTSISF